MIHTRRYPNRAHVALAATILALCFAVPAAYADRGSVKRLSRTLRTAKSEKARISAAVALAKLKDKRATPALVKATRDRKKGVRAMAATALGHLGDKRAVPALKRLLSDDDEMVRRRAKAAIARLKKTKTTKKSKSKSKSKSKPSRRSKLARVRIDAKEPPLRRSAEPTVHVTVKSTADKSRGRVKKRTRKRRAQKMKKLMLAEIKGGDRVTGAKQVAEKLGLESFEIDASIVKLDRRVRGKWVEVECEIRLTISNDRGKMISFLTGGAKVQVPKRTYRRQYLRQMRQEALENAVRNVHRDLLSFLNKRKS